MRARTTTTVATYALLCSAGGVSFMLPDSLSVTPTYARPVEIPGSITLTGILRDFREAHPDFKTTASEGFGHYAGGVQAWLPGDGRPAFVPGGFFVQTEWRDSSNRPIAPHLANVTGGLGEVERLGIRVTDRVDVWDDCMIDSFAAARGPYGLNGNYGRAAYISTNSTGSDRINLDSRGYVWGEVQVGAGGNPLNVIRNVGNISGSTSALDADYGMPALELPGDIGAHEGNLDISGAVSVTWSGDLDPDDGVDLDARRFGVLRIRNDAILTVDGDLSIVCDALTVENRAQIVLSPGANLTFFVTGAGTGDDNDSDSSGGNTGASVIFTDYALCNVSSTDANTGIVTINYFGDRKIEVKEQSHVYATFLAPDAKLQVREGSAVYGAFVGERLLLMNNSAFHVDVVSGDTSGFNPAITVRDEVDLSDSIIDSFDSTVAPYDAMSPGVDALVQTNTSWSDRIELDDSTINGSVYVGPGGDPDRVIDLDGSSTITGTRGAMAAAQSVPMIGPPPLGMTRAGDINYNNDTVVISGNIYTDDLSATDSTLQINGDVTIRCDGRLTLTRSNIEILPSSSLNIYVAQDLRLRSGSLINENTADPRLVRVFRMSLEAYGKIDLDGGSRLYAWAQGAKTELELSNSSEFFGSFIGEDVESDGNSKIHVDMAYLTTCVDVDDTPGVAGAESTGGVTSSLTFDEWYRDVPGTNVSKAHTITMVNDGSGVYEYLDDDFHPIDDALFGSEGDAHNNFFTYHLSATFEYVGCGSQFVEFQGGDGAWAFINGQLVLDLGGLGATSEQFIEVDRLGLQDGREYSFDIFYANRSGLDSVYRLRTNILLSTDSVVPAVTDAFD